MKTSKQVCPKQSPRPKPNLKNKKFAKWTKGESCKRDDNIISTEWHERLQKISPFTPVYDNAPLNMVYLLSGEYGRIWKKERDEWFSGVFVPNRKEQDMEDRRKKIRKEIREAKKAAEIKIRERKERKAKEAEIKAKPEGEKSKGKKSSENGAKNNSKEKNQESSPPAISEANSPPTCQKGWMPVQVTVQCECSHHKKEAPASEAKEENEIQGTPNSPCSPNSGQVTQICQNYYEQLKDIQKAKTNEVFKTNSKENSTEQTRGKDISTEE